MKKLLLVEVFFSWGFMVRPPFLSGGGTPLPYPPPTTLIGALAAPYLRLKDPREVIYLGGKAHSPAIKIINHVSYAVLGYYNNRVTTIVDMNKYYSYAYLRSSYKAKMEYWSSAIGVGKTYSPINAVIVYVVDDHNHIEFYKSAWGINRIGSKEGLVSVKNVKVIEPRIVDVDGVVSTIYPVPATIVEPRENYREVYYWKIISEAYTSYQPSRYNEYLDKYYVPGSRGVYGGLMKVKPLKKKGAIALETPYSYLVLPKKILCNGGC